MPNQDIDVALTYHEETKHSYDSVYRSHHFLDWDNQPQSFKQYESLEPLPLPQTLPTSHMPAMRALWGSTETSEQVSPPRLADLASILFYTAGVTRRRTYPGHGTMLFRAAACTGALYHIELYLAIADLPDIPAGLYHFATSSLSARSFSRSTRSCSPVVRELSSSAFNESRAD